MSLDQKIRKSRAVVCAFPYIDVSSLDDLQLKKLVKIFYPTLRGVPVDSISNEDQLYKIAKRVYETSLNCVGEFGRNQFEEEVIRDINRFSSSRGDERDVLAERIGKRLENFPDTSSLVRKYVAVVGR